MWWSNQIRPPTGQRTRVYAQLLRQIEHTLAMLAQIYLTLFDHSPYLPDLALCCNFFSLKTSSELN